MNNAHQTIHFLVGEGDEKELLPAHKAILEKASDVFERMFRFDEANAKAAAAGTGFSKKIKQVEVTDVEVGAFKAMLAFIYADDLSGLNGDNAISVLYAADKYNLPELANSCLNFIWKLSNVFDALDLARFFGEEVRNVFFYLPDDNLII
uniref:BTB domain-containing protein n=1 Tax=Globodera pallida TaxID=36090 RepID=A0A183C292_GLOPA